ncbi:MAG: exodeoxyribonuclease VII small subunit [Desulfobacteraceae bacterium]|jgi:exodeoxyribonuclease VII small subunit|nr:exodeoxyribonuclease VII small subunit [Desulfobacteraceae bacterium]
MAKKTFEMAMKQLEQIVQDLEAGDMPLEKAIKKFEEGIKVSKYCSEKLDESEKRITLLMRDSDGNNASEIPFVMEDETSEENSDT